MVFSEKFTYLQKNENSRGFVLTKHPDRRHIITMEPGLPLLTYSPIRVQDGQWRVVENLICQEVPLEIQVNGMPYAKLMRTPGLEKELVVGFCFTDTLIESRDDITEIRCISPQDAPYMTAVALTIPKLLGQDVARQSLLKSSSASVHNAHILDELQHNIPSSEITTSPKRFELSVLDELPDKLNAGQVLRAKCGATHGAALFNAQGDVIYCTEDVGRHNALDKLIGFILLNKIETNDKILMLSSRASFEMIQKAVRIAIPVVASVSAPTDLGLQVADRLQCTYISFLKKGGYYIYTHPWRFGLDEKTLRVF
jgi:FdhD protein